MNVLVLLGLAGCGLVLDASDRSDAGRDGGTGMDAGADEPTDAGADAFRELNRPDAHVETPDSPLNAPRDTGSGDAPIPHDAAAARDSGTDALTLVDAPEDARCSAGDVCDDGVACTTDICVFGVCVHTPVHTRCADGCVQHTCHPEMGCLPGIDVDETNAFCGVEHPRSTCGTAQCARASHGAEGFADGCAFVESTPSVCGAPTVCAPSGRCARPCSASSDCGSYHTAGNRCLAPGTCVGAFCEYPVPGAWCPSGGARSCDAICTSSGSCAYDGSSCAGTLRPCTDPMDCVPGNSCVSLAACAIGLCLPVVPVSCSPGSSCTIMLGAGMTETGACQRVGALTVCVPTTLPDDLCTPAIAALP